MTPPEIENIEDLLVVNAILNPKDSVYDVEVTLSNPSFGLLPQFDDEYVRDAEVTITNGSSLGTFVYNENWRTYRLNSSDFPLLDGEIYQLTVRAGGREAVGDYNTVHQVATVESFQIRDDLSLQVQWQDIAGTKDYYSIQAFLEREEVDFINRIPYFFDSGFISDGNRDGTILREVGEGFDGTRSGDSLSITIYRFNELYVDYFRVLENYVGDDPFSEPTQLPSNINGGLGIFAIVQQSDFKVRVD